MSSQIPLPFEKSPKRNLPEGWNYSILGSEISYISEKNICQIPFIVKRSDGVEIKITFSISFQNDKPDKKNIFIEKMIIKAPNGLRIFETTSSKEEFEYIPDSIFQIIKKKAFGIAMREYQKHKSKREEMDKQPPLPF